MFVRFFESIEHGQRIREIEEARRQRSRVFQLTESFDRSLVILDSSGVVV